MKNYIQIRIELKDNVDTESGALVTVTDELQDLFADYACSEDAYPIFTQEVTYEIVTNKKD